MEGGGEVRSGFVFRPLVLIGASFWTGKQEGKRGQSPNQFRSVDDDVSPLSSYRTQDKSTSLRPTNIGNVRCTVSVATIVVVGAGVDI